MTLTPEERNELVRKLRLVYDELKLSEADYNTRDGERIFELYLRGDFNGQICSSFGAYACPVCEQIQKNLEMIEDLSSQAIVAGPEDKDKRVKNKENLPDGEMNTLICACMTLAFITGPKRHRLFGAIMARPHCRCHQ